MTAFRPKRTAPAAEETREKLLAAAVHTFTEQGYEAASIRTICRRASVNIAMVRYHFGDKLGLYRQVVRRVTDADAKKALLNQAVSEQADPREALRLIIHTVFRRLVSTTGPSDIRLMLNELMKPSSLLADEIESSMKPLYNQLRALVGSILGLPIDHPRTHMATQSILGQMIHYINARPMLARLWPEMRMLPQQVEMIADHIADFSLTALAAPDLMAPTRLSGKSAGKAKTK